VQGFPRNLGDPAVSRRMIRKGSRNPKPLAPGKQRGASVESEQLPRRTRKFFINFTPGVSNKAARAMRNTIRNWRIHLKPDKSIDDISRMFNPVIRGWINYYGRFYKSALYAVLRHMNRALIIWARRKYKKLSRHRRRAEHWLGRIARRDPQLFAHWQMGILPAVG
jgi:RNA-directed DNA polymerase